MDGFRRTVERPGALRRWLLRLVALGISYALAVLLLGLGGGTPGTAPWLTIPRSSYFVVEAAFTAPVVILAAILAAAVVYLCRRAAGAVASFDDTFVAFSRATCIATLCSLVPDLVVGAVTTLGWVDGAAWARDLVRPSGPWLFLWCYLTLYLVAFLVLYPTAARAAGVQRRAAAVGLGLLGFGIYQGVLLIFIR